VHTTVPFALEKPQKLLTNLIAGQVAHKSQFISAKG